MVDVTSAPGPPPRMRWNRAARRAEEATVEHFTEMLVSTQSHSSGEVLLQRRERCPICLDEIVSDTYDANLPCGHAACTECIIQYLQSRVDAGQVSPEALCCPIVSCKLPLSDEFLALLLSGSHDRRKLHERLLDFQAWRFVPEPGDGERLVACPSPGCEKHLVSVEAVMNCDAIMCPTCVRAFCAGCAQATHPGSSCEAAELERMDPDLRKLLQRQNWVRCPSCRQLCERESGCNFMTCPSEECQSRTHFCYLCGELLTSGDHAAHYEGFEGANGRAGPFGSVCINKRSVDLSLPSKPPPPKLSVVPGEDEGTIALRLTFGEHRSEPPTMYYRVQLSIPGAGSLKDFHAGVHDASVDIKPSRQVQKYRKYQAAVTPVNVNGAGPKSELSSEVHFHPRELQDPDWRPEPIVPKNKRWQAR